MSDRAPEPRGFPYWRGVEASRPSFGERSRSLSALLHHLADALDQAETIEGADHLEKTLWVAATSLQQRYCDAIPMLSDFTGAPLSVRRAMAGSVHRVLGDVAGAESTLIAELGAARLRWLVDFLGQDVAPR